MQKASRGLLKVISHVIVLVLGLREGDWRSYAEFLVKERGRRG